MRRRMVFSLSPRRRNRATYWRMSFSVSANISFPRLRCPPDRVIEITQMGPRGVAAVVEQHPLAQLGEPGVGGLTPAPATGRRFSG